MKKRINNFSDNVPRWLALADLKIDYYTQFIKTWIPFNAWYMVSYHNEILNTDRSLINHIKDNSNQFRDRIINLLQGDDNLSNQFRNHIAQLHLQLEAHSIPNHDSKITFTSIAVSRNSQTVANATYRNYSYKVEFDPTAPKTTKRLTCEIFDNKKGFSNVYLDEFYDWSLDELLKSANYSALTAERREKLRLCFEQINPFKPVNLLVKPKRNKKGKYTKPPRCIVIDSDNHIYFANDPELISKTIIEMLYLLRNSLFHGEINPSETNQIIYQNAYNILNILIQELK